MKYSNELPHPLSLSISQSLSLTLSPLLFLRITLISHKMATTPRKRASRPPAGTSFIKPAPAAAVLVGVPVAVAVVLSLVTPPAVVEVGPAMLASVRVPVVVGSERNVPEPLQMSLT